MTRAKKRAEGLRNKMANNILLKEKYEKEVRPKLVEEYSLKSREAVPRLVKIVVNMGTQDELKSKEVKEKLMEEMAIISGQRPAVTVAKKSVAGFGIREGNPVGLTVTLRKEKMWSFLTRLITVVLPRLRDFRGLALKSFDGQGNYTIGLAEYTVFPEIDLAKVGRVRGLEITIVTNTREKEKAKRLLEMMGMPFAKEDLARGKPVRKV